MQIEFGVYVLFGVLLRRCNLISYSTDVPVQRHLVKPLATLAKSPCNNSYLLLLRLPLSQFQNRFPPSLTLAISSSMPNPSDSPFILTSFPGSAILLSSPTLNHTLTPPVSLPAPTFLKLCPSNTLLFPCHPECEHMCLSFPNITSIFSCPLKG